MRGAFPWSRMNKDRIHVGPAKVEAIKRWEALRNPMEICQFLILGGYYRRGGSFCAENLETLPIRYQMYSVYQSSKSPTHTESEDVKYEAEKEEALREENVNTMKLYNSNEEFKVWSDGDRYLKGKLRSIRSETIGIPRGRSFTLESFAMEGHDLFRQTRKIEPKVSSLKKCLTDETLVITLKEIQITDKLQFVDEPLEIMNCEVKRLKQSRISIVKVR
nr:putative reverse transcriptase domain-containing protein [Tanacetum cinerariifolium]